MKTPMPHAEAIPPHDVQIACKEEFSSAISLRAKTLGTSMRSYGFRYHRILRALAKANARINGRGQVTQADLDKVLGWSEFFTDREIEL
jgi:hypothetical protein